MTIPSTTRRAGPYIGTGSLVSYPFSFKVFSKADVSVVVADASGIETKLVVDSSAIVTVNPDQVALPGGNVQYAINGVATALPAGYSLVILSALAYRQETTLPAGGSYRADVVEGAMDALAIQIQQQQEILDRAVTFPSADGSNTKLPTAGARALKMIGFDAAGNMTVLAPASGSASDLALQLASAATNTQGAGIVGFNETNTYASGSVGEAVASVKSAGGIKFKQAGAGAVSRTLQAKLYDTVSVKDFGAVGDGAADDTAAIQAAIISLVGTGGTVYFPTGRYKITAQINVNSTRPINLVGQMSGQLYDATQNPPGIVIGAPIIGSWFKYSAPAVRAQHGGGNIIGLNFYDPTGVGATPGINTCTAVLELFDFALSSVQDCTFHWINGSAILGEFVVMSTFRNNRVRYSGAAGKSALWFPSTSAGFPCQSSDFDGNRVEVCHGAAYLVLGANSSDCKVRANGFETETSAVPTNQEFLTLNGTTHQVVGNHFNRTNSTQVSIPGQGCVVSANSFRGNPYTSTSVVVSGNRNSITGNTFISNRTGYEVDITGPYNVFSGNAMYFSGAVRIAGAGNSVTGNLLNFCTATTANLGAGNDWWIQENASGTGVCSLIANNVLSNNGGSVNTTGGIRVNGTTPTVANNTFNAFSGTGNGSVCIRVEITNATVGGNTEANCTTLISTSGIGTGVLYGNNPASGGTALPLTGSAAFDPPSLANGAGVTTTVSCAGAVVGDVAVAGFSQDLQGITVTAWVSSASVVSIRFQNGSGGAVDLAAGTLKVRVVR